MVRIKPGPLQKDAVPRARGSFLAQVTKHGIHVQAWPRKRGKAKEGGFLYQQMEFALVASWASDPEPLNLQTAINLAKTSDNVPRDILMMASYGTLYEITLPDGTKTVPYRMVAPNAQLILDQVTDVPGSILYRAPIGWVGLPPDLNGYSLQLSGGVPLWLPQAGGGGGGAVYTLYDAAGSFAHAIQPTTTQVQLWIIGGGGGGGSGRRTGSGTAASGGAGGGGGAAQYSTIPAAEISGDIAIIVGAGGAGGAARTTDNTNGNSGSAGGQSSAETNGWLARAAGGAGGSLGFTSTAANSQGGLIGRYLGGGGGGCGAGANGTAGATSSTYGALGGGGGAGMPAAPAARNGGASGAWAPALGWPQNVAAGGIGSTSTPAEPGLPFRMDNLASGGGGGGFAAASGIAGDGQPGASFGGGGGGGGASLNGNNSGAGGDGASGAVLIVEL